MRKGAVGDWGSEFLQRLHVPPRRGQYNGPAAGGRDLHLQGQPDAVNAKGRGGQV